MRQSGREKGFTLTEVLMATALTSLLCGFVFPAFVAAARVFEGTVADLELSMASRAMREKLLYRVTAAEDSGGLSSLMRTNLVLSSGANGDYSVVRFQPVQGGASASPSAVTLQAQDGTLRASGAPDGWFDGHGANLASDYLFERVSNACLRVNLTLGMTRGDRSYRQTECFDAQIVNP